jgi:hypothetical protein
MCCKGNISLCCGSICIHADAFQAAQAHQRSLLSQSAQLHRLDLQSRFSCARTTLLVWCGDWGILMQQESAEHQQHNPQQQPHQQPPPHIPCPADISCTAVRSRQSFLYHQAPTVWRAQQSPGVNDPTAGGHQGCWQPPRGCTPSLHTLIRTLGCLFVENVAYCCEASRKL